MLPPVALGSDGPINPYLNVMFASINANNPAEAMTREQAKSRREVALNGVFHLTLERDVPVQLIRITLPREDRRTPGGRASIPSSPPVPFI